MILFYVDSSLGLFMYFELLGHALTLEDRFVDTGDK